MLISPGGTQWTSLCNMTFKNYPEWQVLRITLLVILRVSAVLFGVLLQLLDNIESKMKDTSVEVSYKEADLHKS